MILALFWKLQGQISKNSLKSWVTDIQVFATKSENTLTSQTAPNTISSERQFSVYPDKSIKVLIHLSWCFRQ